MRGFHLNLCDIHNHILFGVDDGSENREMTIEMLKSYHEEGIHTIIATPHYNPAIWPVDREILRERFEEVKQLSEMVSPDFSLYLGCEVFHHREETLEDLKNDRVLTMADSRYLLIEFPFHATYDRIRRGVTEAILTGHIPILAHVERYDCLLEDEERIHDLRSEGALIQVNAGSVTGMSGSDVKRFTHSLLKYGTVDFVATDAHKSTGRRTPKLRDCAKLIAKKFGSAYATRIFVYNPKCVIEDMEIDTF